MTGAVLPFSMQGVILAKITSPSQNRTYPFRTAATDRRREASIMPVSSATAVIGIKGISASMAKPSKAVAGLIDATSPKVLKHHPSGRPPGLRLAPAASSGTTTASASGLMR
jgi:hypothetical protein